MSLVVRRRHGKLRYGGLLFGEFPQLPIPLAEKIRTDKNSTRLKTNVMPKSTIGLLKVISKRPYIMYYKTWIRKINDEFIHAVIHLIVYKIYFFSAAIL